MALLAPGNNKALLIIIVNDDDDDDDSLLLVSFSNAFAVKLRVQRDDAKQKTLWRETRRKSCCSGGSAWQSFVCGGFWYW